MADTPRDAPADAAVGRESGLRERRVSGKSVLGMALVVLAGLAVAIPATLLAIAAADPRREFASEGMRMLAFERAMSVCAAFSSPGRAYVLESGEALEIVGVPLDGGAVFGELDCVLGALFAPETVVQAIRYTEEAGGTQVAHWTGYEATWEAQPDGTVSVTVRHAP